MPDDETRGLEILARADASPANHRPRDGCRAWIELTGFQRDCLEALARRERDGRPCYPSGIAWTLVRRYPRVSRARLEPALRALCRRGLVAAGEESPEYDGPDRPATAYRLTGAGNALLIQRAERLAALCELRGVVVGGGAKPTDCGDAGGEPAARGADDRTD
ncbi:PadR family transcriptional regulator [Natrinema halophilum]|uniref:PadR family transcriptional regulator n=1 Tax=Natrinema halophilum TaxID=1699371 RepID=A0A7D5GNG4_9EURY|nr:PadR family transcriptional regulator [Natrinema halophilum]QLG50912.1 PadR family transcriptional regulator [Natrinema halophilum]